MTHAYELPLDLDDFTQINERKTFEVSEASINDGEIILSVDKLALTANSISYGLAGKSGLIRYLDIYPTVENHGNLPCWGYADVVISKHPEVAIGDRVYGFLPIASHVIVKPGRFTKSGFTDINDLRSVLPAFYNEYAYTKSEPGYAPEYEDTIIMFRPLFGTSYLMQTYCEDHAFHGATRVVVTSASAKTAMGFGYLMKKHYGDQIETIGLTSNKNLDFVNSLDCFNQVLTYDEVEQIEAGPETIIFDVAGNDEVVAKVHQQLGDTIPYSGSVGKTHWDTGRFGSKSELPGARPVFWSGPDQIMSLRERHGAGEVMRRMGESMFDFVVAAHAWINMSHSTGPDAIKTKIQSMLAGEVSAQEGIVLRPE